MREWWKAFWRRHPSRLTRKQKIVRNALCILLLLVLCYRLADCPPLTAMHAFRQAERQNLAGPSEVIARIPGENVTVLRENLEQFGERNFFGDLSTDWVVVDTERTKEYIIGERDGTLYCFWWEKDPGKNWLNPTRSYFYLKDGAEENTVFALRRYAKDGGTNACILCVRTDMAGAATAFAEVRTVTRSGENYTLSRCSGEGTVHGDGIFIIAAYQCAEEEKTTQAEYEALDGGTLEVHVVVKNAAGDVIWEETRIV